MASASIEIVLIEKTTLLIPISSVDLGHWTQGWASRCSHLRSIPNLSANAGIFIKCLGSCFSEERGDARKVLLYALIRQRWESLFAVVPGFEWNGTERLAVQASKLPSWLPQQKRAMVESRTIALFWTEFFIFSLLFGPFGLLSSCSNSDALAIS